MFPTLPDRELFHAVAHHGAARGGWAFRNVPGGRAGGLVVVRGDRVIPPVTMPSGKLVLAGPALAAVEAVPADVELRPLARLDLVDFHYEPGDRSFYTEHSGADPEEVLFGLDATPDGTTRACELVPDRQKDLPPALMENTRTGWFFAGQPHQKLREVAVAPESLGPHPVQWWGCLLLREDLFEALRPFLDFEYFTAGRPYTSAAAAPRIELTATCGRGGWRG